MLKMVFLWGSVAAVIAFMGVQAAVRLSAVDPEAWHVDPASTARTGKPNDYLVREGADREPLILAQSPQDVARALFEIALAQSRTELIAGSIESGWFTLMQRTALMGYPDFISVKISESEGGSVLRLYSRSRDGHSDLGVNKARVGAWLSALDAKLASS